MGVWIVDLADKQHALKVNFWNWRPTVNLIAQCGVLSDDQLERISQNASGGLAS